MWVGGGDPVAVVEVDDLVLVGLVPGQGQNSDFLPGRLNMTSWNIFSQGGGAMIGKVVKTGEYGGDPFAVYAAGGNIVGFAHHQGSYYWDVVDDLFTYKGRVTDDYHIDDADGNRIAYVIWGASEKRWKSHARIYLLDAEGRVTDDHIGHVNQVEWPVITDIWIAAGAGALLLLL